MADLWLLGILVLLTVTFALWGLVSIQRARRSRLRQLVEQAERAAVHPGAPDRAPPLAPPLPAGQETASAGSAIPVVLPPAARPGPARSPGPLAWLGRRLHPLLPATAVESANWRLLWAGRPLGWTAEEFVAARIALALLCGALAPLLVLRLGLRSGPAVQVLLAGALALMGLLLPDLWLTGRIEARRRQVQQELPLFLDLVAAAVEAGLSLGEAVRRVADELPGLVAAEFMRAYQEMAAGKPRAAAWRDLAHRTPSQELRAVANAILQSEQYGTSVAAQLRLQVRQLRETRQRWAQELAQAASVKMRIPMLLFIMIPFLALVLGPALLGVAEMLH